MSVREAGAEPPSNWGRWGLDDERGTLNFITDATRARGVAEARDGLAVSLAATVTPVPLAGPIPFGASPMPAGVLQIMNFTGSPARALTDTLVLNTHHAAMTHIDALAHIPSEDKVYPGIELSQALGIGSVRLGSTAAFAAGIVTRGVFLDLAPGGRLEAGHWVTGSDLDEAEGRAGIRVESGDALVVRGGWQPAVHLGETVPAMSVDAVRWMADHEVCLYAGDICDRPPFPPSGPLAMHQVALARLGMPLIDGPELAGLTATCTRLGRYGFLFVVAPMAVVGATGLPVNPLAIFLARGRAAARRTHSRRAPAPRTQGRIRRGAGHGAASPFS
jgi:kynurenine formamidase